MVQSLLWFLTDESGSVAESLIWTLILALGMASLVFRYYAANHQQAAYVANDLNKISLPTSLPSVNEDYQPSYGMLGGVTSIKD